MNNDYREKNPDYNAARANKSWDDAMREAENVAREIEGVVRDVAVGLAQTARQTISAIRSDVNQTERQQQAAGSNGARYTVIKPPGERYAQSWVPPESRAKKRELAKIRKKRAKLAKKTGKPLAVFLIIVAIALFIASTVELMGAARGLFTDGFSALTSGILAGFFFAGGVIALSVRNIRANRLTRKKRHLAFIAGRGVIPMSEIARAAGVSEKTAANDILAIINEGYLESGAYIDEELDCLVQSPQEAELLRRSIIGQPEETQPEASARSVNQYMEILLELRSINDEIADVAISDKADRIEILTGKIFRIVEEDPEKLPQIRRFMSYYLPTTIKLLRSYATLEKQGINGENITSAKESIGGVLDTLALGFEQQLDQLFSSDVLDIASDINVLENLMQQDGLAAQDTIRQAANENKNENTTGQLMGGV